MGRMENKVVVDTDVIIDYLRRVEPQADVFKELYVEDRVLFTSVSAYELRVGSERAKRQIKLQDLFQPENTLVFDLKSAIIAGRVLTDLRTKGQEISPGDILIAGICLSNGLPLLTRNTEHFCRIPKLRLLSAQDFV